MEIPGAPIENRFRDLRVLVHTLVPFLVLRLKTRELSPKPLMPCANCLWTPFSAPSDRSGLSHSACYNATHFNADKARSNGERSEIRIVILGAH